MMEHLIIATDLQRNNSTQAGPLQPVKVCQPQWRPGPPGHQATPPSNLETNPGETTRLYFKEPKLVRELKTIRQEYKESCRHGIGNTWPCQVDLLLEALVDDRGAD